jgi:hypothetical protein
VREKNITATFFSCRLTNKLRRVLLSLMPFNYSLILFFFLSGTLIESSSKRSRARAMCVCVQMRRQGSISNKANSLKKINTHQNKITFIAAESTERPLNTSCISEERRFMLKPRVDKFFSNFLSSEDSRIEACKMYIN